MDGDPVWVGQVNPVTTTKIGAVMKAISGSIVLLSGALMLSGGVVAQQQNDGPGSGVMIAGIFISIYGFNVWYRALKKLDG